jgi:hypothetical protein
MDGSEVASGTDCTVISYTRLTPNKSFARVLASSVRLGLGRCGEATPVVVLGARSTPNIAPAGVPASSTRSGPTADEVLPPAWPRLPRLLLLRRGGWQGKPGCSSSATVGRHHWVRLSHPVLEGKPNANYVRARIKTHVHSDYINEHHHTMLE